MNEAVGEPQGEVGHPFDHGDKELVTLDTIVRSQYGVKVDISRLQAYFGCLLLYILF